MFDSKENNMAKPTENKPLQIAILTSWVLYAITIFLPFFYPKEAPIQWSFDLFAVLGLLGSMLALNGWRFGKAMVIASGIMLLLTYFLYWLWIAGGVGFYKFDWEFWAGVNKIITLGRAVNQYWIGEGAYFTAAKIMYFEFVMPLLQALFLVMMVFPRRTQNK
jgi:hypothetical protein